MKNRTFAPTQSDKSEIFSAPLRYVSNHIDDVLG